MRMASTQFCVMPRWASPLLPVGMSHFQTSGLPKPPFVFFAEFADGFAGAPEGDVSAFHDDFAAVASDFEAVGAWGFACCGDEYAPLRHSRIRRKR